MYQVANSFVTIAVIVSLVLIIAISLQKPSLQQKVMQTLAFCILLMSCGYYLSLHADSLQTAISALKLRYLGMAPLYALFVGIYLIICKIKVKKKYVMMFLAYKIICMLLILTFDQHSLYYKNISLKMEKGIPILVRSYGIVHSIYTIEMLLCFIVTIVITIKHYRHGSKKVIERTKMFILLAATIIPFISYCVHLFANPPLDPTPLGILISSFIFFFLVLRYNLCNVKDAARNYVFESLYNAHVVVDENYMFEEANTLAQKILPELNQVSSGKKIDEVSQTVADIFYRRRTKILEHDQRLYQPICQILKSNNQVKGYMASLIDVTDQQTYLRLLENYQKDLERDVVKQKSQIEKMQQQIIISFANIAENRDGTTGKHIKRTSAYVQLITRELLRIHAYPEVLDNKYAEFTYLSAPLHDIGKVMIPDGILCKPGRLTMEEFEVIKTHTTLGGKILEETLAAIEGDSYLEVANQVAVYHHERWDGTGYPKGLSNVDIPLCARIMAVADVFDALVSERPYKKSYSMEAAFQIISSSRGTHFDPIVVDAFLSIRSQIETAYENINELTDEQDFTIVL